ncbi:hypothetical protein B0H34DRAFT_487264 [Crassisporium funariophilum]|nr:hypothetical protein B0H34DRAFT_487264 [Crassisporium funariophilum]
MPPSGRKFYLFGFPIAHSAAPTFHNYFFETWDEGAPNTYELWSSSQITNGLLKTLIQDECGGAAVTMPLKQAMLSHLDEISAECESTGACNTIVKVPTPSGFKLVGQNTDILGVRNTLLRALRLQFPALEIPTEGSYYPSVRGAGLVIGGGATTRSAIYALSLLGLSPVFLINRDDKEIEGIYLSFPALCRQGGLIHLRDPTDVDRYLKMSDSAILLMVVGAIPSTPPATIEEHMVYTTVSAVLQVPYKIPQGSAQLPIPNQRIFLEMTYKPRVTPLLQMAKLEAWFTIDGVQATIEQGLAQQRMWFTATPTLQAGSDHTVFDPKSEESARQLCENMNDILPNDVEVDRATESF